MVVVGRGGHRGGEAAVVALVVLLGHALVQLAHLADVELGLRGVGAPRVADRVCVGVAYIRGWRRAVGKLGQCRESSRVVDQSGAVVGGVSVVVSQGFGYRK